MCLSKCCQRVFNKREDFSIERLFVVSNCIDFQKFSSFYSVLSWPNVKTKKQKRKSKGNFVLVKEMREVDKLETQIEADIERVTFQVVEVEVHAHSKVGRHKE